MILQQLTLLKHTELVSIKNLRDLRRNKQRSIIAGTVVGDVAEVIPIDEVFCKHREGSLLIGSVKSNMGHSEHVAALAQIAKVKSVSNRLKY